MNEKKYIIEIAEMDRQELDCEYEFLSEQKVEIDRKLLFINNEQFARANNFCYPCEKDLKDCKCNINRK